MKTHGLSRKQGRCTPEYRAWNKIKSRCGNPKDPSYPNYGGRGISLDAKWVKDFSAFLSHVGPRPSLEYSIDRYPNNDGNYEPGNVRWATRTEQCQNRRSNRWLTLGDKTMTLVSWAKEIGISHGVLDRRLSRHSVDVALAMPKQGTGKHGPPIRKCKYFSREKEAAALQAVYRIARETGEAPKE